MEIKPGDILTIRVRNNTRTGIVTSAYNYGTDEDPNWYIELDDYTYGATYWKQGIDGGEIVENKEQ